MNRLFKSLAIAVILAAPATADLILGTANSVTAVTATGELNGVNWTATTTSTAPFLGINLGSGVWDLPTPIESGSLFLGTNFVNAGDTQTFTFDQPVTNLSFYVENFDSGSIASVVTDGIFTSVESTPNITFLPSTASTALLANTNMNFDGVGDLIMKISGRITYVQFDYAAGEQANGVFYGFAVDNLNSAAVPEPSAFVCLLVCASGVAYLRRNRLGSSSTPDGFAA